MKVAQIINNKIHWIFDSVEITGKDELPNFPPDQYGNPILFVDITGTDVEEGDDYKGSQIDEIKKELAVIDEESGSGRAIRCLSLTVAENNGYSLDEDAPEYNEDYKRLHDYEERAIELRAKLEELKSV